MINLGIVGLGLIGASIAKALCQNDSYILYGADSNGYIVEQAINEGVIAKPITDMAELDAVIFATPPKVTKELINGGRYKKGAVVMDVCGVKGYIKEIKQDIDFVGMHPMAGKELSGYDNGDGAMFKGKNLLLVK
ncbi:MAG: prephenate dehydrogenase/arogenate dehydrogenase family protein, partial [Clostridia bacterium]|nr:prephenate dehydrogenase/arogenate dehydrogenase family protein [Clostridia bacterium]